MDQWFRNQSVLRIVSLLVGIMLWLVVNNEEVPISPTSPDSTTTYKVSVQHNGDLTRYAAVEIVPETVSVVVTGRRYTLNRINPRDIGAYVDVSGLSPGDNRAVPVRIKGVPDDTQMEVVPNYVQVRLVEKVHKELPVSYRIDGMPSSGFQVGNPIISPNKVTLIGAEENIEKVFQVIGVINVQDAESEIVQKIKLTPLNEFGKEVTGLTVEPQVVNIEVPITSPYKELPFVLDVRGKVAPGLAIEDIRDDVERITVYGPKDAIDALDFYMGPFLDVSGMKESMKLSLDIPIHGGVYRTDPKTVNVEVLIVPSRQRTLEGIVLQTKGVTDDLEVVWVDPPMGQVDVTIEGAPKRLDAVLPEDVQGIVDVSDLPVGVHQVKIDWNLPLYIKGPREPMNITVEIREKNANSEASVQNGQ
jgi:YbbR domain-containing protein